MSIDFDGATSKLENTAAALTITTQITICAWVFADSTGEGGTGRILCLDELANAVIVRQETTSLIGILLGWSTPTYARWTVPAALGRWHALVLSYDWGSTANNPEVRVNFAGVTASETVAPSGTAVAPAAGYCVGNVTGQTSTWGGEIAHVQVFNRLLSAAEMDDALRTPGSVTSGQRLWLKMANATDVADYTGNGFNGTGTALTTGDTDPIGSRSLLLLGAG